MTKVSFDNGKTWRNRRVVDPSVKHKYIFKCDIDDVEHCFFQDLSSDHLEYRSDPTPDVLIKIDIVEESDLSFGKKNLMTFISRDGGASWEIAFEYPVYAIFLDFGNIVVAIPKLSRENNYSCTKFFSSLDHRRNWKEYYFDEPIRAGHVLIDGSHLNAILASGIEKQKTIEYIFYALDFSDFYSGKACKENDLETWYLTNGNCIDGVRYSFKRGITDSQC